ncbi:MAG: ATP synthase F1 subunit delta [Mollicutes bacterium PWAP]|nr:ATP synthase F1 subunit delta [Mollicutes bacterium PWAP]
MSNEHVVGYFLALFELSKEEKKLLIYKEDSLKIIESIQENTDYLGIINSRTIKNDLKINLIDKAFKKYININLLNFLKIIAERRKGKIIIPTLLKLIKKINKTKKIIEGKVYSASKLTNIEVKSIQNKVSKEYGINVILTHEIDKSLFAGFKIVIGSLIIEDSVHTRLKQLKNELINKIKGEN